MNDPLVSVVMGVFNGAGYIRKAIESVLSQSYRNLEMIVVDDGSSDGSGEIASSFPRTRVLRQPNRGLPSALNRGTSMAEGAYLSFIDADDLWPRERLSALVNYLRGKRLLGFVCGRVVPFRDGTEPGDIPPEEASSLSDRAALSLGSMLVRTEVFRQVGAFDTQFRHSHDVDWVNRAKEAGIRMEIVPVIALKRRIHSSNISKKNPERRRSDFLRAVKAAMDRRRGAVPATRGRVEFERWT